MTTTSRFPFSLTVHGEVEQFRRTEDGLRGLGRTGTQEVVTAVGELVQVDVLGQQLPVAVALAESRRGRVVRSDHHGDRRGQPLRRRVVKDVGEIAVRRHVVVAGTRQPTCSARSASSSPSSV